MSLSKQQFQLAAAGIHVDPAALHAVADVETSGQGFLPDGRPKILFEGWVFWNQLRKRGINPSPISAAHPTVCFSEWTTKYYLGGAREYARLLEARNIHRDAANESASWGLFQLMGYNYATSGYVSVTEMITAFANEQAHLDSICRWMMQNGLARHLAQHDWPNFARGYNGPGVWAQYATKLEAAYARRAPEYAAPVDPTQGRQVTIGGKLLEPQYWMTVGDGRIFVHVRSFELLGHTVAWNAMTGTVEVSK